MEEELISNGLSAFIEDNFQTAVSYFSKVLEKNESNERALLYRACAHNKIGEYELALKDLTQIKTESFEILYQRAIAHLYGENFEEAKKALNEAKKINQSDTQEKKLSSLLTRLDK
jgi:tetratricopeptide (TPR) repeat protein